MAGDFVCSVVAAMDANKEVRDVSWGGKEDDLDVRSNQIHRVRRSILKWSRTSK